MNAMTHTVVKSLGTLAEEARLSAGELIQDLYGLRFHFLSVLVVGMVWTVNMTLRTEQRRLSTEIEAHREQAEKLREVQRLLALDESLRRGAPQLDQLMDELGLTAPGAARRSAGGTMR